MPSSKLRKRQWSRIGARDEWVITFGFLKHATGRTDHCLEEIEIRKVTAILLLVVIALQPFLIFSGMVAPKTLTQTPRHLTAQEPGPRLEPEEFINHVPIYINGTDDFEAQNWPGSGTDVDPYVISGLNITYGIGVPLIQIENTDAYFVIQDCFMNQLSATWAVSLYNVSHGSIVYTYMESNWGGALLERANGTLIDHVYTLSGDYLAVYLPISTDCILTHSVFNSTNSGSIRAEQAHQLRIEDTVSQCHTGARNLYLLQSNHTTIQSTQLFYGTYAISAVGCHWFAVDDLFVDDPQTGLDLVLSPNSILTDIHGTVTSGAVLEIDDSQNSTIDGFTFLEAGTGMYISSSNDTRVANCILEDVTDVGIEMHISHRCNITNNAVSMCADGIYTADSHDLILSGNTVTNSAGYGIVIENGDRVIVDSNSVHDTGLIGIHLDTGENCTFSNNAVDLTEEAGILLLDAPNVIVEYNTVSNTDEYGILLAGCQKALVQENTIIHTLDEGLSCDTCPDLQVLRNVVIESESTGLYFTDSPRAIVFGNEVLRADDGIYIDTSVNISILENTITEVRYSGITAWGAYNGVIANNTIDARTSSFGLRVEFTRNATIASNDLTGCGIYLGDQPALIWVNHTIHDNTVNSKPFLYLISESDLIVSGGDYGQIAMVDCTNITVSGGVFEYCSVPIVIYTGEYIHIEGIESVGNYYGCIANPAQNLTLIDSHFEGVANGRGLGLYESDDAHVEGCTFRKFSGMNGYGIDSYESSRFVLISSILEYNHRGLYLRHGDDALIAGCDFNHNEYTGIYAAQSADRATVEDCYFLNSTMGIYVDNSDYWNITDCEVRHCTTGIYIAGSSADFNNVTSSIVESCGYGIRVSNGDNATITNNTVRWCTTYGIYLSNSDGSEVYYNTIAFNSINGYDNDPHNWDDGVSEGNWWGDYTPPPPYSITAGGGGAVDNYPNLCAPTTPVIDQPMDLYYAEGSTGNELTWNPRDDELRDWTVKIDSQFWASGAWNFDDITVEVDGLPYGTHMLDIIVYDVDQNNVTDQVLIHVYDDTPPVLKSQQDTIAFEGATGQTITWSASDLNPDSYVVRLNGEIDAEGTWTDEVTYSLDELVAGMYEVELTIYDLDRNSDSDVVTVLFVYDDAPPAIDSPSDTTIYEGRTGTSVVWTATDDWPASYQIESNGSVVASGPWAGARIIFSLDGIEIGSHSFEVTVYDQSGNSASDIVEVTVLALPIAEEEDVVPMDPMLLLLIVGGIAAVVAVSIAGYLFNKRRGT